MITINILVKPGSARESITKPDTGEAGHCSLVVRIPARPVEGAANVYLANYLSRAFGIRKNEVVIEKGLTSKFKKVKIYLEEQEFEKRLAALIEG